MLKISNDKKSEILFQSFDILKDNFEDNDSSIDDLIAKMAAIDINAATEMWKYIIKKHKRHLKNNSYHLTDYLIKMLVNKIGSRAVIEMTTKDSTIKEACFLLADSVLYASWLARDMVLCNDLQLIL